MLGGRRKEEIDLWAAHPGGRSILDAIASALGLTEDALDVSRDILRRFGNMSSATVIFVLKALLDRRSRGLGCAMAFGPGLTAGKHGLRSNWLNAETVTVMIGLRLRDGSELPAGTAD